MKAHFTLLMIALLVSASCSPRTFEAGRAVLLYSGAGTSPHDVKAVEAILKKSKLSYCTLDSHQLNSLTESQLLGSQLLIVPGGNYIEMAKGLPDETIDKVRSAIERGLNYLGICGGAILAGRTAGNSLNLTSGVGFDFYADVNRNIHKNVVAIATAQGETFDQYWEDGPQLGGWGKVVSKYPDGSAATVQGAYGRGWVLLCGFHPEAPESWRRGMKFNTTVHASNGYASMIIEAALRHQELPHY